MLLSCLIQVQAENFFFLIHSDKNELFFCVFFYLTGESFIHLGTGRIKIVSENDIYFLFA